MSDERIDCVVLSELWATEPLAEEAVRQAVLSVVAAESEAFPKDWSLSVALSDNAHIQKLNAQFRGKDKPTNVLSFPTSEDDDYLGDIAIAFETVRDEALAEKKLFLHHVSHLAVHGTLHLLGFEHENDEEAEEMEQIERHILTSLGIADPYADLG